MSHRASPTLARSRALPITSVIALIGSLLFTTVAVLTTAPPVGAAPVEAGFKDHAWGASGSSSPTQDKPQSKVWFADGSWWGGLFTGTDHNIYRYDAATHTWTDTGVTVDDRNASHADYLWDGATNSLYVASVNGPETNPDPILVFKLNYNASTDTYAHDPAFGADGVEVGSGPSETVTIAKDSTGQLWITYQNPGTSGRDIMVNRSTTDEHTWGEPFSIGTASGDDISAIIAFGGDSVGVMWSDQNPAETQTFFYWSEHADADADDTEWSTKKSSAQGTDDFAEDHVNLKLVATNSGDVLAAVKTNGGPDHIQVLRRNGGTGNWTSHVVVGGGGDATRPQILVDSTNSRAYVFFTTPESSADGDQAVHYKSAPLGTLAFDASGLGTPLIKDGGTDINDVSTAKHSVTSAMGGILAIASGTSNRTYYHGWVSLGGATPTPTPSATPTPTPSATPTPTPSATPTPTNPFVDVDQSNKFYNDILWIYNEGITVGCASDRYCPKGLVTRAQMATFLVRALNLPPSSTDFFSDDDDNKHEARINALAASGITVGCAPDRFCPDGLVTRAQMATFLVRGYDLPSSSTDFFTDDDDNRHEARINALAQSNITRGCGPTTFCPDGLVNREQMAAFIHRAETR